MEFIEEYYDNKLYSTDSQVESKCYDFDLKKNYELDSTKSFGPVLFISIHNSNYNISMIPAHINTHKNFKRPQRLQKRSKSPRRQKYNYR